MQFCLITDLNQMPHKQLTVTQDFQLNTMIKDCQLDIPHIHP